MFDGPVYLTGGTGYIGTHFRRRLASGDTPVSLLVRPGTDVSVRANETVVRGDITEKVEIPDGTNVVHLAAQTSVETAIERPQLTWNVNATGTLNVLEAARDADIDRFLYVSTASVYGPPESIPISESHPLNAVEPYGASKLAGDRLIRTYQRTYGLDAVTARVFNTFGPRQPGHNVVPTIISQALDGGPVELGNLSPSRDFLYIDDVIEALLLLPERGREGEAYNIGSGKDVTIGVLAEKIIDLVDPEITLLSQPEQRRNDSVEIEKHVADVSKLEELGWKPERDLEDGLQNTIRAFKDQ